MKKKVIAKVIKGNSDETTPSSRIAQSDSDTFNEIIDPPYDKKNLEKIKEESTILQQCIDAYKQNIPGFGVNLKYRIDETQQEENEKMKKEKDLVNDVIKYFNFDKSFEDVLKDAIEDREICGEGYIEILRDGIGLPVGGEYVDTTTVKITKLGELVQVTYVKNGKIFIRKKKFRRFIQETFTKKIYFKEFGDPRILNYETGVFDEFTPEDKRATELIRFKIGNRPYGIPRWIGPALSVIGSRKAEELNYNYFKQGRHTPLAILVKNGVLSEDSEASLAEYASSVEGSDNAHKFLLLEVEALNDEESLNLSDDNGKNKIDIEIKDLAGMLQKDALFIDYDEATRKKVQSSFRLPDIYIGRSNDFNRATAEAAIEITEKQVFIPERKSLAFTINNCLLNDYNLQFVDLIFNNPDISNTDDKVKMINVLGQYNGIAPNDLREEASKVLGKPLENFDVEGANLPTSLSSTGTGESNMLPFLKSQNSIYNSDLINILKDVRDVIEEIEDEQGK